MKMDKFQTGNGGIMAIRKGALASVKLAVFGISGTDLTVMQFESPVDFDAESDLLIEMYKDSEKNLAFEYVPHFGFDEVDTDQQGWFHF